jgi:thiol-disulfide isomerase/thioredoxin
MAKPRKPKPEKVGIDSINQTNTKAIVLGVVGVIVALALIAVAVTTLGNDGEGDDILDDVVEFRPVTITGNPLPSQYSDAEGTQLNEAIGAQAPDIGGSNFTGETTNVTKDGRGKALIFLAHWCPHCQAELPLLSDWVKDNAANYSNVDFYAVATGSHPTRANYPPSEWILKDEKWPAKVIVDNNTFDFAKAYGLGSYPYMVFLNGQNQVVTRTSGEIAMTDFANLVQRTQDAVANQAIQTTTTAPGATTTTQAPSSPAPQ